MSRLSCFQHARGAAIVAVALVTLAGAGPVSAETTGRFAGPKANTGTATFSHAAGKRPYVAALALGAVAAGVDGLMIEVHPNPDHALSDGMQSLNFDEFAALMPRISAVASAVGKSLRVPEPAL